MLISVVNAAKGGDLTVRAETTAPTLAPLACAINEMLEALSRHASEIARSASQTLSTAEALGRAHRVIAEGLSHQQVAIAEIARRLKALEARSDEISQIVELFDDVTSETNILALNAAIEASHSGDEQSGFSVVADEIRTLAEKSAEIAGEVSKWVKQIETVIERGGESSREAGKIFDTIARDLGSYAGFIHELSGSVREQLGANREVTGAIESIGSVVEDNRFSAEAVTRIIEDLKKEMTKLESLVGDQVPETARLAHSAQGAS